MVFDAQSQHRGVIAVLIAAVLWGTTGTAATFAPDVSAAAIGAAAMGIGGLLQAARAGRAIKAALPRLVRHWGLLVLGALAVAVYPLAFYGSMRLAGVTIGTVITIGSAPFLSALLEYAVDGTRLSRRWLIGAVIGLIGMLALTFSTHGGLSGGDGRAMLIGVGLGLLGGFTYALYSWTGRGLMLRGVAPSAAMGATFGLGGVLLMPVLILTGAPFLHSWGNAAVGLYMALVPMFLGYICFGIGLSRISSSLATTITLVEPVVAALLAIIVVGERLTPLGWSGVALVILCLAIITLPVGLRKTAPTPI